MNSAMEPSTEFATVNTQVKGRYETLRKLTKHFQLPIREDVADDPHFWFLVAKDYQIQKNRIQDLLEIKVSRDENLEKIRKLAITNAFEHASHYSKLEMEKAIDPTTKLYNKAALDAYLLDLLGRKRDGFHDVVIFIDFDELKQVNDTYGHEVGNIGLQEFTSLINVGIRRTDFFARYGGDEFILVFPQDRDPDQKDQFDPEKILQRTEEFRELIHLQLAGRVKKRVKEELDQDINFETPLTASFGAFFVPPELHPKDIVELDREVYKKSDGLMYEAKRLGKNVIVDQQGRYPRLPQKP